MKTPLLFFLLVALTLLSGPARAVSSLSAALPAPDDSATPAKITLATDSTHATSKGVLYYVEDPLGQWSLPYLLDHQIALQPYPKDVFNEGFTASAYWLRLDIDGTQASDREWLLEINYPLLDVVNLYIQTPDGRALEHFDMGDLKVFADRPFSHRNFVVPLNFSEEPQQRLYINVQSSSSMQVPLNFWEVNHFIEQRSNEQYGLGLYYGMMLVMFLYNFFLWASIRDKDYLHYIAYIASFAGLQLATSGLGYQFIWSFSPWIEQIAVPLTIGLVGVFGTTFTRGFLQTKIQHRYADIALRVCLALSAMICISAFVFDIATVMSIGKFVVVIFLATVFYASIVMLIRGHRQARFFLAAWVTLIVGGMITIGMMLGHLPNNLWTTHASKIGSGIEIVLLSFALADRIKILQRAKLHAETMVKKELEERAERLAESNRLKNDFLATISHEFRTPLNGIIGSLELAGDEKGPKLMSTLQDARSSARDMLELVDNVLTYTELQAGNRILAPEVIELSPMIRSTVDYVRQQCDEKHLGFELKLEPGLPNHIRADIKCIRHAVKALLENAIKFTEEGHVSVAVGVDRLQERPCLDIRIADTGIGMTATELARVQDYFCQADTSMHRQYQGLGIGLSLVRAVCHVMQGDIQIDSVKHGGTSIRLRLPVQPLGNSEVRLVHDRAEAVHLTPVEQIRGRALIVEDNTINQRVLNSMLNRLHLQVDVADNGEKALEILEAKRSFRYDLIFMDCQMPVMDGFEATHRIRSGNLSERDAPIIAVTANAMSGDEQRCLDAGMNDYLSKPISMDMVRTMVMKWLPEGRVKAEDPTTTSGQQSG
ncbi:7TM diverse intracellular signaling domain-containing protein [Thalassolituus sp. LLYu03]|uniref:7TM diverse intracellular signaling domain-containing protein n=1 Tax=Thalassolituus sp. LLYu03 TaxID=3421656 RepID=UPI003D26F8A7